MKVGNRFAFRRDQSLGKIRSTVITLVAFLVSIAAIDVWFQRSTAVSESYATRAAIAVNQQVAVKSFEPISTGLAARQSFGFFDDIGDNSWNKMRKKAVSFQQYQNPKNPNAGSADPWKWYIRNLQPDFTCQHVIRVGGHGDGPKWVCDPHRLRTRDNCLIYSFGSNGNYLFEDSMLDLVGKGQCEIHVFDFGDFDRPQNPDKRIHYHQWGLGSSYDQAYNEKIKKRAGEQEVLTFQEIQRRLNHEDRTIDLFKIDCEGCEWRNYKDWIGVDARQVQIEVHGLPSSPNGSDFFDAFRDNSFAMFSKEHNQYTKHCYEFSYVKLSDEFWDKSELTAEIK
jgi:hypothetical protein